MISKKLSKLLLVLFILTSAHNVKAATLSSSSTSCANYVVQSGDSLWTIAKKFNVSLNVLSSINKISSSNLYYGQTLLIPATTYTVKNGDSLWSIANKLNVSSTELLSVNNRTSSNLYPGEILTIPNVSLADVHDITLTYTVQAGDSLWIISNKFDVPITSIISDNRLISNSVYPDQKITIKKPAESISPTKISTVNYTVQIGDNLWNLAQKYKTTENTIVKSSMLATNILMPGQILTIPINSATIVKPEGITMYKQRANNNFGDIYTWENGRRIWTVGATGTLKDLATGISFNVKYYGGSNHSDIVPLTKADTANMIKLFKTWSWNAKRPMILIFTQGGVKYQMAVSLTGMPHSTTDIYNNGVDGHFDLYFYNSTSHVDNTLSPQHQQNILKANGQ